MTSFRTCVASGWNWLRRTPGKPLLLLTFLCLVVREQFPFSDFPMYSSFTNRTFYVHLADQAGQPVATLAATGMHTSKLKKIYETELHKEVKRLQSSGRTLTPEQKRPAGEHVLAMLKDSAGARRAGSQFPPVVRLYEVNISLIGGRFEKQSLMVAEAQ